MTPCKFCGQQTNDEHPDWFLMTRTGTMGSEHRCVLSNECDLRAELREANLALTEMDRVRAETRDERNGFRDELAQTRVELRDLRAAVLSVVDMIDGEKRRNGAAYGSPPSRIAEWAAELREAAGK